MSRSFQRLSAPPATGRPIRRTAAGLLAWPLAAILAAQMAGCVVVVHDHSDWEDELTNDDGAYHGSHGPRLGVWAEEPGRALAAQTGVDRTKACVITDVREGWPAEKAGLKKYDLVTAIDGNPSASARDLTRAARAKTPGEAVRLTVLRNGQTMDLVVPTAGR